MTLQNWLHKQKLTVAQFAQSIGVQKVTVYRWLYGHRIPSPAMMRLVMEATDGAVTANDLLEVEHKEPGTRELWGRYR
jgi:transcriptional regulator with XRE-family HTH domain